jgi:threonine dehydrogenase-like Zn-dependent dehydrogenase
MTTLTSEAVRGQGGLRTTPDVATPVPLEIWHAAQRRQERVEVREFDAASRPEPGPGQALVRVLAAGICGADIRIVTGNKESTGSGEAFTTLGHEGVGVIEDVHGEHEVLHPGMRVFVLPHLLADEDIEQEGPTVDVKRIGAGRTQHMGWDIDGVFSDYVVAPTTHLVLIAPEYLRQAELFCPDLSEAVFAFTEPMLCTLSSYELARREEEKLGVDLLRRGGRALILGCGPIGILHAVTLRAMGYRIALYDPVPGRMRFAQWTLGSGEPVDLDSTDGFETVIVASSSARAIRTAEQQVREGGLIYLFAGLNADERDETDEDCVFLYERVHRVAKALVTTVTVGRREKSVVYLGHSGYYDDMAPQAIAAVAANAGVLGRVITGVIPGWDSAVIRSHGIKADDWHDPDGGPALIAVLRGADLKEDHAKLIVRPGTQ